MLKERTKIRLELISARARSVLADGQPWHNDVTSALAEIISEATAALNEVNADHGWKGGER